MAHSARREKNPMRTSYDLPILRTMLPSSSIIRSTTEAFADIANFQNHLNAAMNAHLRCLIDKVIEKSSKKKKNDSLSELKTKLLRLQRVRGLLAKIDQTIGETSGVCQSYTQKHKINVVDIWRSFVSEHFDEMAAFTEPSSSSTEVIISDEDDEDHADSANANDSDKDKGDEIIRSFAVPIKKVLREDLSEEFAAYFYQEIKTTTIKATNFTQDLGAAVTSTALWIPTIQPHHSNVKFQDVIPSAFREQLLMDFCNAAKWEEYLADASLASQVRGLFGYQHLQMLASANFGVTGIRPSTSAKYPLWSRAQSQLHQSGFNFTSANLARECIANIITKKAANISNMWSGNKRGSKALDNILDSILQLHLRPTAELARMAKVKKSREEQANTNVTTISRNRRRSLIQKQKRLIAVKTKIMQDGEEDKLKLQSQIDDCQRRIERYGGIVNNKKKASSFSTADKPVAEKNDDNDNTDDNDVDIDQKLANNDISMQRLRRFKGVLKSLLWKEPVTLTSKNQLSNKSGEMTDSEFASLKDIYNCLILYMPPASQDPCIAFQIPLIILSNQLSKAFLREYNAVDIMPKTKSSVIHSLHFDSSTIFSLLGAPKKLYAFRSSDGSFIRTSQMATWNKGAIFGAIFNLKNVLKLCGERRLSFSHTMQVHPDLKNITIQGSKTKSLHYKRTCLPPNPSDKRGKPSLPITQQDRTAAEIRLKLVLAQIEVLNERLRAHSKSFNLKKIDRAIRDFKLKYTCHDDTSTYLEIKKMKQEREVGYQVEEGIRRELKAARQEAYHLRRDIERPTKATKRKRSSAASPESNKRKKLVIAKHLAYGIDQCHNIILEDFGTDIQQLYFSGSDPGVKAMSVTTYIQKRRFDFHKALYNSQKVENFEEFLDLPPRTELTAAELNHRSSYYQNRYRLEHAKRTTAEGRFACSLEKNLQESSFFFDTSQFLEYYKLNVGAREGLRSFYSSSTRLKQARTTILRTLKAKQIMANRERTFGDPSSVPRKVALMCVGNAGTGVGSPIKGHSRRGGKWLQRLHAHHTVVAITNEHRTSQTCIFCFGQVTRPFGPDDRKINGASRCMNSQCIAFRNGRACQGRDTQASIAIAIAGLSTILDGQTLPPFNPRAT